MFPVPAIMTVIYVTRVEPVCPSTIGDLYTTAHRFRQSTTGGYRAEAAFGDQPLRTFDQVVQIHGDGFAVVSLFIGQ